MPLAAGVVAASTAATPPPHSHLASFADAHRNAGPILTRTVGNTNVMQADITRRTGMRPGSPMMMNSAQSMARQGSTSNMLATIDQTRVFGRANQMTRTALG